MKKLFLDTNILIDLLSKRQPFSQWATKIFRDQKAGKWKLYSSSNSILTTYYVLSKKETSKKSRQAIKILLSRLLIISIEKADLLRGLITEFADYEDSMQHECALKVKGINYIVTRNIKDFKHSVIPVISPEELYINH